MKLDRFHPARRRILQAVCDSNRQIEDGTPAAAARGATRSGAGRGPLAASRASWPWIGALMVVVVSGAVLLNGLATPDARANRNAALPPAETSAPRAGLVDALTASAVALQAVMEDLAPSPVDPVLADAAMNDAPLSPFAEDWLVAPAGVSERLHLLFDEGQSLSSLFGLDVRTIVLDPGHGGVDPGASGAGGTQEKDITLDIARRLKQRLEQRGNYRIIMTRETDTTVSLRRRVALANAAGADLFLSIHVNALPNPDLNIVETYYFGLPTDRHAVRLVRRENRHSGLPMSEFKRLMGELSNTLKYQESAQLAGHVQRKLFGNLRKHDHSVLNVGVKTAPFVVLSGVEMPSVLAEISCISNRQTERRLSSANYREELAAYLEQGVISYLTTKRVEGVPTHGSKHIH